MNKKTKAILARAGSAGLLGAMLFGVHGSASAAGIFYSGRATVASVSASALVLQPKVVIGDTGNLEPWGATRGATAVSVNVPAAVVQVQAGTISAYTSGSGKTSASSASVQKVHVNLAGLLQIDADVVDADSSAQCNTGLPRSFRASSSVGKLVINGLIIANIQPNTTVTIPIPLVGAVTLNEQTRNGASIGVNAIHVSASALGLAGADVVIGHAESGIGACPP